ncbi:MAG: hypothetical protein Q4B63_05305 [Clostridium perfringens]|nr:hypothetical protein [Clostridium perfringens]
MNKTMNFIKRVILFFIGMSVIQFGVAVFLKTNIGSDPFTVFTQGLANTIGKTPGVANMIILVVLITAIFFIERKRIKIGTLICVVGVGPIIDLSSKVVSVIPIESYNFFVKMLIVVVGVFIIAAGFSLVSGSDVGVAPNDIVPFIIQDKTKVQYKYIRIALDATFLVVGYLIGGTVGVGTIIAMLAMGPFIQFCLPHGKKVVDLIVGTDKEKSKAMVA